MDLVHPDSIYSGPVVGKDLNLNLGDYSPWNLLERLLCSRLSICVSAGQRIICASQKNTGWPIDTRGLVKSQAPSSSSSPLTLSNSGFQFAPHQPPPPSPPSDRLTGAFHILPHSEEPLDMHLGTDGTLVMGSIEAERPKVNPRIIGRKVEITHSIISEFDFQFAQKSPHNCLTISFPVSPIQSLRICVWGLRRNPSDEQYQGSPNEGSGEVSDVVDPIELSPQPAVQPGRSSCRLHHLISENKKTNQPQPKLLIQPYMP